MSLIYVSKFFAFSHRRKSEISRVQSTA